MHKNYFLAFFAYLGFQVANIFTFVYWSSELVTKNQCELFFLELGGFSDFRNKANSCMLMVYDSLKAKPLSFVWWQRYVLIFSIYIASSNKVSLSSNAIQILWSCACVNSVTCPSSILLLLSCSYFSLFFWTRIHEYDDSLYLFSFCFRGMMSFCMIDHDGQWLMSCTCMVRVRNVHSTLERQWVWTSSKCTR